MHVCFSINLLPQLFYLIILISYKIDTLPSSLHLSSPLLSSPPFFSPLYFPLSSPPLLSSPPFFSPFLFSSSLFFSTLDLDFLNYCDIRKASNRLVDQQEQTLQYLQFYYFGEEIIQPISIQSSDWHADNLEFEQLRYATYDALMCRQIYDEINKRGMVCYN